jgi:hypothetical protein
MVTEWHITRQQDFDEWIWVGENVLVNQDVPLPPSPIYGSGVSIPLQFTVYYDESSIDIPQIKAYLARPQTPQLSKGIQLWKEAYDQSFTKYQNGDMNESLRLFMKAVDQGLPNSDQAVIHGAYADHFFLHNDIDSAYEHCLRSIELDPSKFWKVHFYLSLIYEALDEKEEAKKAYRNARRFAQTQWFTDEGELDVRRAIQNWTPHPLPKPVKPDIFTGSESKEVKSPIGEKSPKTHEEKIRNKSTETTKKCPLCAEQIPLASVTCEYCGTQFTVTSTGYCQICHDVREADENGQCKVCGNAVIDLRMESKLIEETVEKPLFISPPIAQTEVTSTRKSRLPIGVLAGILILAVIGAFLWFGRGSIPVLSNTLSPSTSLTPAGPTAMSTSTPKPGKLNPANQHRYLYVRKYVSWQSAQDTCLAQAGHLVTIQDEAENLYVYQLSHGQTWLGATDKFNEGTWVWVSGEPWQYTNWRSGQPDNNSQSEDHLAYYEAKPSWGDVGEFNMFFVCEWESISP